MEKSKFDWVFLNVGLPKVKVTQIRYPIPWTTKMCALYLPHILHYLQEISDLSSMANKRNDPRYCKTFLNISNLYCYGILVLFHHNSNGRKLIEFFLEVSHMVSNP